MEQPNFYAIIPASVRYDKNLTANAKLLYGEITALCNQKGYCWANNKYFADLYSASIRSITRWINDLADGGYINIKLIYKNGTKEIEKRVIQLQGAQTKTSIPIDKNDVTPIDKNITDPIDKNGVDNNTSKSNNTDLNITSNNTKDITPIAPTTSCKTTAQEKRFEMFWAAYPKKLGKGAAEKAFKRIKPDDILLAQMIVAIKAIAITKQWQENNGQFIPYPATWLNQRRWEDEPELNRTLASPQLDMANEAIAEIMRNG